MATDDKPDVSCTSEAYDSMAPKWDQIETLLGGTAAMRGAGKRFLPQYPEESDKNYKFRLSISTLLNLTKYTLQNMSGRVFRKPIKLDDNVPTPIVDLVEDIDNQGNHLQVFAQKWFTDGLGKGLSHVLIDFTTPPARDASAPARTKADDEADGLRPYWVHVRPENLIFAHASVVGGRRVLDQVRIREEVRAIVDWDEQVTEQIRVLYVGRYEVWQARVVKRKVVWVKVEEATYDLPYIPLITFYAGETGFMTADPPLMDLADLNIAHWQSSSDQRNILSVARFPMLAASGVPEASDANGAPLKVGPKQWLSTPDPAGKFYYVEHTGAAISAGRQDLVDLEDQMGSYGSQFLKRRLGNQTATAAALDSSETASPLQAITLSFKDAVENALNVTADWLKIDGGEGGTIKIETYSDLATVDQFELTTLVSARTNRDISRETFLDELKRRDILSDDFDEEENAEQLAAENDVGLGAAGQPGDVQPDDAPGTGDQPGGTGTSADGGAA